METLNKRYQIFISSTYSDLKEERDQVTQAIMELNHMPYGMEAFPAANATQWEWIKQAIEESDYYIAIIGGRYGSVNSKTGLSYTEMEYRFAEEIGVPTLAFIVDESVDLPHSKVESDRINAKKLEAFKKYIEHNKLRKSFTTKEDLKSKVITSIIQLIRQCPRKGWIRFDIAQNFADNFTPNSEVIRLMKEMEQLKNDLQEKERIIAELPVSLNMQNATIPDLREDFDTGDSILIGKSQNIVNLRRLIDRVAPSDARVFITGPSGTEIDIVARLIHQKSRRKEEPFVDVNCAAIPEASIESELFGHAKGAFSSAVKHRKGKFDQANGGTLYLNEIGDMSLSAQSKILWALQHGKIQRVGSDELIPIDVRIIASSTKNLREEVEKGRFREDLYHRITVIVMRLPPLLDRKEDIPLLIEHYISESAKEYGITPKKISSGAIDDLMNLDWPGNVRELRNTVERLVILSGDTISKDDVEAYV